MPFPGYENFAPASAATSAGPLPAAFSQPGNGNSYNHQPLLTNDKGGDEARGRHGRVALRPERLQQVVGEGERRDGVAGRDDDEQRRPQVQERRQRAEGLVDVRVVPAGLEIKHHRFRVHLEAILCYEAKCFKL